jgi:hypothetical protein
MFLRALEAIHFQSESSLLKALATVFQDAIDYRDGLRAKGDTGRNSLIVAMYKYVQTTTLPKFVAVIKKETNIDVTKVVMTGTRRITGLFAINLSLDNYRNAETIVTMQTGQRTPPKTPNESLKEMMELHNLLNISTGKLSKSTFGKSNNRPISCALYMDPMFAFLLHEFIPEKICEEPTAQELAAIYLHEIGHLLTMVERSGDWFAVTERLTTHIPDVVKSLDPKVIVAEFNKSGAPYLNEMAKKGAISKEMVNVITQAVQTVEHLSSIDLDSYGSAVASLIGHVIETILTIVLSVILNVAIVYHIGFLANGLATEFTLMSDSSGKSSDQMKTHHNLYMQERLADEFVSRHGAGGHLSSVLNKLEKAFGIISVTTGVIESTRLRKSTMFTLYLEFCVGVYAWLGGFALAPVDYEEQYNRIQRLIQNANVMFKNELKNTDVLNHYLADYAKLEKELEKAKGSYGDRIRRTIYDYLVQYANPTTVLAMLLTGRLSADYEKQQKLVEALINNDLYALSAKLRHRAIA